MKRKTFKISEKWDDSKYAGEAVNVCKLCDKEFVVKWGDPDQYWFAIEMDICPECWMNPPKGEDH